MAKNRVLADLESFLSGATEETSHKITNQDIRDLDKGTVVEINALLNGLDTDKFYRQAATDDALVVTKLYPERTGAGPLSTAQGDSRIEEGATVSDDDNPFRPKYRKLGLPTASMHDEIKAEAMVLLAIFRRVPTARKAEGLLTDGEGMANLKLAQRHLEDAVYRAVTALTA